MTDLIYPRHCPLCDGILKKNEKGICSRCAKTLTTVHPPRCEKCGRHLTDNKIKLCRDCRRNKHFYTKCLVPFVYEGSIKDAVLRLKYSKRAEYAAFFAAAVWAYAEKEIKTWNITLIVPVPIHSSRRRKRGYNQAELIAEKLSAVSGIPCVPGLVKRVKKTQPQKELKNRERIKNLLEAFEVVSENDMDGNVLVIDDIYTTGSTIDSMAIKLSEAGFKNVYAICVCAGEPGDSRSLH